MAAQALAVGALAPDLMPSVERAAELQAPGYWPVETGHARAPDGAVRVFVLTQMPGVTPAMWDWWFAWHGSDGLRYKLWHPQAHLDVAWADGRDDLQHYVGRTSKVVEYVGATRFRLAIRFIAPAQLGLDEQALKAAGEVAICARVGLDGLPFETAWLVHHVRPVAGGVSIGFAAILGYTAWAHAPALAWLPFTFLALPWLAVNGLICLFLARAMLRKEAR